MRASIVTTSLALIAAVASSPTGNSLSKAADGKRHWQLRVRDDAPAYNLNDDGPAYNPSDDGPANNPKDDGPTHNPKDDGPANNAKDDGPANNPQDDGPAYDPKDDGPVGNPKDDGSDNKPAETPQAKPKGDSTSSVPAPTSSPVAAAGDFIVTILADSNRDGKVDMAGETDRVSKDTWTEASGAVFLANIADTDGRCSNEMSGECASTLGDVFRKNLPEEPKFLNKSFSQITDEHAKLKTEAVNIGTDEAWNSYLSVLNAPDFAAFTAEHDKWKDDTSYDKLLAACHDASDDVLRNPEYLAPLRTTPNPQLSNSATGSVSVAEATAASKVRIFHNVGSAWKFVSSNYTFKAEDLKAGLELGIDARDVRRPGGWDGRATVQFKVKDGEKEAKDSVMLRVAPVLTQHHGQLAMQLLTASGPKDAGSQAQFVKDVQEASSVAGLAKPLHVIQTSECDRDEIWAQDFFEPGYTSMPGPDGPIGLHIMIGSAQSTYRRAGRKVFQELRSNTAGAVQHPGSGGTTDSTGNLETVPPHSHNGKSYPAGRAIMGSADGEKPQMMAFLEVQETQDPIEIDTSWLAVKHTDEFMQFLPVASSERGWIMMVDDPRAGLEILQKAEQAGHGNTTAVSRPKMPADPQEWRVTNTVADVLKVADFAALQNACATSIEKNIDIMKRETGITDAEIIRIPSLYQLYQNGVWKYSSEAGGDGLDALFGDVFGPLEGRESTAEPEEQQPPNSSPGTAEKIILDVLQAGTPPKMREQQPGANTTAAATLGRRQDRTFGSVVSLYPATINSVVLGNNQILAANPWGPVIDGQDILAAAVNASYAKANYTVRYMDDWFNHHEKVGDVHCGTNVIRDIKGAKWW